ncbi:MAG: hypothetical protein LBS68_00255 [Puniceicoccales bacterium]|nr:hypothetical protein [Puniceicoccales bacterium]
MGVPTPPLHHYGWPGCHFHCDVIHGGLAGFGGLLLIAGIMLLGLGLSAGLGGIFVAIGVIGLIAAAVFLLGGAEDKETPKKPDEDGSQKKGTSEQTDQTDPKGAQPDGPSTPSQDNEKNG